MSIRAAYPGRPAARPMRSRSGAPAPNGSYTPRNGVSQDRSPNSPDMDCGSVDWLLSRKPVSARCVRTLSCAVGKPYASAKSRQRKAGTGAVRGGACTGGQYSEASMIVNRPLSAASWPLFAWSSGEGADFRTKEPVKGGKLVKYGPLC